MYAYRKSATPMLPAGFEVAKEQFKYAGNFFANDKKQNQTLKIDANGNKLTFNAGDVHGEFDVKAGRFTKYYKDNGGRLDNFLEPYFWSAPTDNDFGNRMPSKLGV